ncbi:hypothetical protein B0F90DRAFT_1670713 [Multifurca ochricompacta]|uniref:Uncharacterized protein n=1 Tax=Multifurca ochricompacta TaxID=376703 RepID=A0AAD4QK73_9AGAM|nr:hypothetical protein B0F90DRAFT_1670713 [Multifurca ochricompacta]
MAALILQYLPKLLPEVKVSPLPEIIFLSTMKALIVPASHLSATQWSTVASLILLTNTSPALRKATLQLYGYLSLIIGAEIALVNAYVLVCSWISPSTALQPLTVVILNVLNSIIPIFTDSVILFHLVKEKASHTDSRTRLIATTGGPILFKFARLVGAAMYIYASIEFILASFTSGTAPDLAIVEAARVRGIYISSSLHLIDNL